MVRGGGGGMKYKISAMNQALSAYTVIMRGGEQEGKRGLALCGEKKCAPRVII